MMQAEEIRHMIAAGMPEARVEVRGEDGTHFDALIVSEAFAGKNTLARHRLVYAALGERMGTDIHALSLRTLTPQEQAGS